MDERDLQEFQDYVRELDETGARHISQGLANLVMIQKRLTEDFPVDDIDRRDFHGRSEPVDSFGFMNIAKVYLEESDENAFFPLIEGLRRSTLNVRLKDSIYDIIDPMASELLAQQYDKMSHENELHREDVIYYRNIISSIDNLGKSNRSSFLESVLLGYRRFIRNPIWTSLDWTLRTLQTVVFRPLMGILSGFKKKSDTDKIVDAIDKQTEFLRTGQVSRRGVLDQFRYGGIMGVIGGSISNAFGQLFGGDGPVSPQQQQNEILEESNRLDKERNTTLQNLMILQKANGLMMQQQMQLQSQLQTNGNSLSAQAVDYGTVLSAVMNDYVENVAAEQLEQQEKTRKELEEHNKREKRRTLLSFFKTIMPGVLGILGLGAIAGGAWYLSPDKAKEVIGGAVGWGMNSLLNWNSLGTAIGVGLMLSPFGLKIRAIGAAVAGITEIHNWLNRRFGTSKEDAQAERDARMRPSAGLGEQARSDQEELESRLQWLERDQKTLKTLTGVERRHMQAWIDDNQQKIQELRRKGVFLPSEVSEQSTRFSLTPDNQRPILEARQRELEERIQEIRDERRRTGEYGINQELIDLTKELRNLKGSIDSLENTDLMQGMVNPIALQSALQVAGGDRLGTSSRSTGGIFDFVKRHEGLRTEAYLDQAGIPTIGYGNTMINGRPVRLGDTITEEQAEQMFKEDFMNRRSAVSNMVSVPLEPHQLDALTSLSYNIGLGALRSSTLLRNLNSGDFAGAQEQFGEWNKITDPETGQKVVSRGLTRRRQEEAAMFGGTGASQATPVPSNDTPTISREVIESSREANIPPASNEDEIGLLAGIKAGIENLSRIFMERGESGNINLSDSGTSHAAYGD